MRRIFAVVLIACLALAVGGCKCALEKAQLRQLERNHKHIFPAYLEYVEKDASLDANGKDDEKKLIEATDRLVDKMQESVEE